MEAPQSPVITPVVWAFAPDWLTVGQACHLSGHDLETMQELVDDGCVETKLDGKAYLIDKDSLHEFQECLLLVSHWDD